MTMHRNLRRALDIAYERMKREPSAPVAFTGNYGLCLGIIMGAHACNGLTDEEATSERAYLAMLVALHDMQSGGCVRPQV